MEQTVTSSAATCNTVLSPLTKSSADGIFSPHHPSGDRASTQKKEPPPSLGAETPVLRPAVTSRHPCFKGALRRGKARFPRKRTGAENKYLTIKLPSSSISQQKRPPHHHA
jgi:hypothetical protein